MAYLFPHPSTPEHIGIMIFIKSMRCTFLLPSNGSYIINFAGKQHSLQDLDQPVHPCSLIPAFAGYFEGSKDLQADIKDSYQSAQCAGWSESSLEAHVIILEMLYPGSDALFTWTWIPKYTTTEMQMALFNIDRVPANKWSYLLGVQHSLGTDDSPTAFFFFSTNEDLSFHSIVWRYPGVVFVSNS